MSSWFAATWRLTDQNHGISAVGLQRMLGLGCYETAWAQLHKLRRALVRPGRELLSGLVAVAEGYVGGREAGLDGRQIDKKPVVVCALRCARAVARARRGCG